MAIIGALCGRRSLRRTEEASDFAAATKSGWPPPLPSPPARDFNTASFSVQYQPSKEPPPAKRVINSLTESPSSARNNKRRVMGSLSMRMPRSLSMRLWIGKEEEEKAAEGEETEDSVWMKTIILGERCRVPAEEDDDAVFYDDKGIRISTYHPRTTCSLPVSRTSSYIDPTKVPRLHGVCEFEGW